MTLLRIQRFHGIVPRSDPRELGPEQAQIADNCDLASGALVPFLEPSTVVALPDALRQTIYPYNGGWLSWTTPVNVVPSPITDDEYSRIYYTGDGKPKVRAIIDDSEVEYDLGIPAPATPASLRVRSRAQTTWTREWFYFYEDTDGRKMDEGSLTEGVDVVKSDGGATYTLASIPARVTASASAMFVMGFNAFDADGFAIGILYPSPSRYSGTSELTIEGAQVTGELSIDGSTAVLTLTFDVSGAGGYTEHRVYVYTYVDVFGAEGPPSDPSDEIAVNPTQEVVVYDLPVESPADQNIVAKRIYRTVTSGSSTLYQYVDEVTLAEHTYFDRVEDADTGEEIPSATWLAPPEDLAGLVAHPGKFLAGFSGRTVWFSEVNLPHAWPEAYALTLPHDVVALGITENAVVAVTKGYPYVIVGATPDAMTPSRLNLNQACASARGLTDSGVVAYPSPDGIVFVQGGVGSLASKAYYTRETWQETGPTTMVGQIHDDRLFLISDTTGLIMSVEPDGGNLVTTDQTVAGFHVDIERDLLYFIDGASIKAWGQGTSRMTATWRSRKHQFRAIWTPVAAQVIAESYPVSLVCYAAGAAVATVSVTSDKPFKLPFLRPERDWEFELVTDVAVYELSVADSMGELQ